MSRVKITVWGRSGIRMNHVILSDEAEVSTFLTMFTQVQTNGTIQLGRKTKVNLDNIAMMTWDWIEEEAHS